MNGNRIGKGRMINKNGEIYYDEFYNNNEGLFCLNVEEYYLLKSKILIIKMKYLIVMN